MYIASLVMVWLQITMALHMWWAGPEDTAAIRGLGLWILSYFSFVLANKIRKSE